MAARRPSGFASEAGRVGAGARGNGQAGGRRSPRFPRRDGPGSLSERGDG
jgi:hypothetical protein